MTDREAAIRRLRSCADRLVGERPEVKRVLLFGSLARGDFGPRSDADIIIILRSSSHRKLFYRIPDFLPFFLPSHIPVDVLPYTEREIERMRAAGNPIIRRVMAEGVELASAAT